MKPTDCPSSWSACTTHLQEAFSFIDWSAVTTKRRSTVFLSQRKSQSRIFIHDINVCPLYYYLHVLGEHIHDGRHVTSTGFDPIGTARTSGEDQWRWRLHRRTKHPTGELRWQRTYLNRANLISS